MSSGRKVKEGDMVGDERCIQYWTPKVRGCFGDLGVDGRISTEWILKTQVMKMWNVFIWARWRSSEEAPVNMETNLEVPYKTRNFLTTWSAIKTRRASVPRG
jgi:hypothetical protein